MSLIHWHKNCPEKQVQHCLGLLAQWHLFFLTVKENALLIILNLFTVMSGIKNELNSVPETFMFS
jgi:hypothetical protein